MRLGPTLLRTVFAVTVGCTLGGCCGDDVSLVDVGFGPYMGWPSYAWPGDTITVYAMADRTGRGFFCPPELYNSVTAPERFRYSSTNTTVATVTSRGLLTARALGVAHLVAVSAGISDSLPVIVSPAFASLHITVTPATARVGDTIRVQADALDGNGAVITGAQIRGFELRWPSLDTLATWLPANRPYPSYPVYTFPTPLVDHLVVRHPGVVTIIAVAPHEAGQPLRFIAESVVVSIAAP
jgi:hypothetical protein